MTGRELLNTLQALGAGELQYIVLVNSDLGWVKLGKVNIDSQIKSIDLEVKEEG